MALPATVVFEVRTAGSDNNGGGFVEGGSGTDFSQQNSSQFNGTNLTVDIANNTKVTPDGHTPTAADVDNLIQITAGVGWTTGFYRITAQDGVEWTLDRSPAAVGVTGGTWRLGGALQTLAKAAAAYVGGNDIWVKADGTYNLTAAVSWATSGASHADPTRVQGYTTTRGDHGRPTISTTGSVDAFSVTANHIEFRDLIFSGANDGNIRSAINGGADNITLENLKVTGHGRSGVPAIRLDVCTRTVVLRCEVTPNTSDVGTCISSDRAIVVDGCYLHGPGTGAIGIQPAGIAQMIARNTVISLTGSSAKGIYVTSGTGIVLDHCVIYGCGSHGIDLSAADSAWARIRNSIIAGNGGYGVNLPSAPTTARTDYCAFYNNASGNVSAGSLGEHDVVLTADPFTNAAGGDFTLNQTAGGGAACRGAGFPGTLPGLP